MKRVAFRIRRIYFDKFVSGEKKEELRSNTAHWRKMLLGKVPPRIAVFVCGKDVHRRWITRIYVGDPEKVLGRPLSPQGKQDISTESVIVTEVGEIYD